MAATQMQLRICKLNDGGLVWKLCLSGTVASLCVSLLACSRKHVVAYNSNRTACPVPDKDGSKSA